MSQQVFEEEKQVNTLSDPDLWVEKYGDRLYYYAWMQLRNKHDAENAVQETLLAALKSKDKFAGKSTELTWLTGILRHKIMDHFRRQKRQAQVDIGESDEVLDSLYSKSGMVINAPTEWSLDPSGVYEKSEFWDVLNGCLSKLPKQQSEAFYLKEVEGLKSDEICNLLGITATNLWVLLHRARQRLRLCLEKNWIKA